MQSVAFSAQGTYALSAGSDSKLFLFDGKSGSLLSDLTSSPEDAHKGTIYGVEFHPQKEDVFASTGADGFLKIWQVQEGGKSAKVLESFNLRSSSTSSSASADDQQVALCFAGADRVVSLGLSSDLFVAHLGSGGKKFDKVSAPSKSITSISAASSGGKLYAGSYDGKVCEWDLQPLTSSSSSVNLTTSGGNVACRSMLASSSGSAAVTGVAIHNASGIILSVGLDDTLKWIEPSSSAASPPTAVSLSGQPRSLAVSQASGTAFVATTSSSAGGNFDVISAGSGTKSASQTLPGMPGAIAVHPKGDIVVVGSEDAKVRLFAVSSSGGAVKELSGSTLSNGKTAITALAFSPDGTLLAAGESSGKIVVYDVSGISASGGGEGKVKILHWVFHTARINSIAFSPDGEAAVSGSL